MGERRHLTDTLAVVVPIVLPVVGGLTGVVVINTLGYGNPLIGVAGGAVAGWAIAAILVRLLDRI